MILSLSLAALAVQAQPGEARPLRRVVALLDYVSNDYARAWRAREVLSEAEHAEQIGFVQDAASELRADVDGRAKIWPGGSTRSSFACKACSAGRGGRDGARGRDEIVQRFGVVLVPQRAPISATARRCTRSRAPPAMRGRPAQPGAGPGKTPPDFRTESGPFTAQRIFSAGTYEFPRRDAAFDPDSPTRIAGTWRSTCSPWHIRARLPRTGAGARGAYPDALPGPGHPVRRRPPGPARRRRPANFEQEQALAAPAPALRRGRAVASAGLAQAAGRRAEAVSLARKGDRDGARRS